MSRSPGWYLWAVMEDFPNPKECLPIWSLVYLFWYFLVFSDRVDQGTADEFTEPNISRRSFFCINCINCINCIFACSEHSYIFAPGLHFCLSMSCAGCKKCLCPASKRYLSRLCNFLFVPNSMLCLWWVKYLLQMSEYFLRNRILQWNL